jgi:hypothetical protein
VGFEPSPKPDLSTFRRHFRSDLEVSRKKKALKRGQSVMAGGSPRRAEDSQTPERRRESDPACPPSDILEQFITEAKEVFGVNEHEPAEPRSGSYGFIDTTSNCSKLTYGYSNLYYKREGALNIKKIKEIREEFGGRRQGNRNFKEHNRKVYSVCEDCGRTLYEGAYDVVSHLCMPEKDIKECKNVVAHRKGKYDKLKLYKIGFLEEEDICHWFEDMVRRQNSYGIGLVSPEGKTIISQNGRWCNAKGKRSIHIQKVFKEGIGEIKDCILLTLTTHETEVRSIMPYGTRLLPVQYATIYIGSWISTFIRKLRKYQKRKGIPWEFVGWTLEFQENGYPHVHMIFRGRWIGSIQDIATLWPYSEPQGVDYMDKRKYERQLVSQGKLKPGRHVSGIRLINYVTAYVSKCSKALVVRDNEIYVHKGYAWLAFFGGRLYNVAREYKKEKKQERQEGWRCEGLKVVL